MCWTVADNIVQYWWWQWWRWWQWQRRGWWRWWRWWWWEKPRRQLAHLSLCGAERSTSLSPSSLSPSLSSSLSSSSSSSFLIKIHYSQLSTLKTLIRWFLTWVIISTPPLTISGPFDCDMPSLGTELFWLWWYANCLVMSPLLWYLLIQFSFAGMLLLDL